MTSGRTGPQPAGFTDVRVTNLSVVVRHVRAHAPCSRADIAASTGLNKATVSSLVAELIDRNVIRETGLLEHRIGRPATMLVMDGSRHAAIGLEVDVDHLSIVAVDLSGERVLSWRRTFPGVAATPSRAVASIVSLLRKALARVRDDGRAVLGVTVGVPGLVDADGVVALAPNLGWRSLPLRQLLGDALADDAPPITVANSAALTALAEYRFGAHAGTANLVALSGEAGVGAGIIAQGQPLNGSLGYAGEIGHFPVGTSGPLCGCGRRGCLEAVVGIPALIRLLDPHGGEDGAVTDFEPEVQRIAERAATGDPTVRTALHEAGTQLGLAVSALTNLLNPEVVVLGGYYVPLGPWIVPAADAEVRARTVAPAAGGCHLALSTLGHGSAALGGAARILDAVDAGELPGRVAAYA